MTPEGWTTILSQLAKVESLLNLNLEGANLRDVSTEVLVAAVTGLSRVHLGSTEMTVSQWSSVLTQLSSSSSLTDLNLQLVGLSGVSPSILATAVSRLTRVNLLGTWLSFDQWTVLLDSCLASATLSEMILQDVSLLPVAETHTHLLAGLAAKLTTVDLAFARLSTDQRRAVVTGSLVPSSHLRQIIGHL